MSKRYPEHFPERNAKIVELYRQGNSASIVAQMMGFKTRNVVVGVVERYERRTGENLRPNSKKPLKHLDYNPYRQKKTRGNKNQTKNIAIAREADTPPGAGSDQAGPVAA